MATLLSEGYPFGCREVEKKEEAEEVMSLDGPRKKPKLEPEMITVKQVRFCS